MFQAHLSAQSSKSREFRNLWTVQYPVIAYRLIEHNVIALCDTLHPERPQIYLDLMQHRVKSFVGGDYLLSEYHKYQTDSLRSNLILLVNCTDEKVQSSNEGEQ